MRLILFLSVATVALSCAKSSKPNDSTAPSCTDDCTRGERCDAISRLCVIDDPPTISLQQLPVIVTQPTVTVSGKARDDERVTKVELSIDGITFTSVPLSETAFTAVLQVPTLDAQNVAVTARATDENGQQTTTTATFMVDRVAPLISFTGPKDVVGGTMAHLTGKVTDGSNSIRDATASLGSTSVNATVVGDVWTADLPLPAGKDLEDVEVLFSAKDAHNNAQQQSFTIRVDTTGPKLALTAPIQTVTGSVATVIGTASDTSGPVATVTVATQNSSHMVQVISGAFQLALPLSPMADGVAMPVTLTAADQFGNTTSAPASLTVDNVGPAITMTSTGTVGSAATLVGTVTDGTGPVSPVTLTRDGGTDVIAAVDAGVWRAAMTFDAGLNGVPVSFLATARDAVGNLGSATVSIVVDTVAPKTFLDSHDAGALLSGTTVTLRGHEDDVSATTVEVDFKDGKGFRAAPCLAGAGCPWSVEITLPQEDGVAHAVAVRATDVAGNTSMTTFTLVVDTVAPSLTIVKPVPSTLHGARAKVEVSVNATDGHGVALVDTLFENVTAPLMRTAPASTTFEGNLPVKNQLDYVAEPVVVRARDLAGNVTSKTVMVIVDVIPPTLKIISPSTGRKFNIADFVTTSSVAVSWAMSDGDPAAVTTTVNDVDQPGSLRTILIPTNATDNGLAYSIIVRAVDTAYNPSEAEVRFTVDRVAPTVVQMLPADGTRGVTDDAFVEFSEPVFTVADAITFNTTSGLSFGKWNTQYTQYSRAVSEPYKRYTMSLALGLSDASGNPVAPQAARSFMSAPKLPANGTVVAQNVLGFDVSSDQDGVPYIYAPAPSGVPGTPFTMRTVELVPTTGAFVTSTTSSRYSEIENYQAFAWLTADADLTPKPRRGASLRTSTTLCTPMCRSFVAEARSYVSPTVAALTENMGTLVPTPAFSTLDGTAELGRFNGSTYDRSPAASVPTSGPIRRVSWSTDRWLAATALNGNSLTLDSYRCTNRVNQPDSCAIKSTTVNDVWAAARWAKVGNDGVTLSLATAGTCSVLSYRSTSNSQLLLYADDLAPRTCSAPLCAIRQVTTRISQAPTTDFVVGSGTNAVLGVGTASGGMQLFRTTDCNQWKAVGSPLSGVVHARPAMFGSKPGFLYLDGTDLKIYVP